MKLTIHDNQEERVVCVMREDKVVAQYSYDPLVSQLTQKEAIHQADVYMSFLAVSIRMG